MVNILVPVKEKDMIKFCQDVEKMPNVHLIVGVTEQLKKATKLKGKNTDVKVFSDETQKEQMINALKAQTDEGKIIVCRKAVDAKVLQKFINSEKDIALCKIKRGKFKTFLFNCWQKIVNFVFGIGCFEGDTSVVAFSKDLFKVLNNTDNLSYYSRINKWKGVSFDYIDAGITPVKMEYDKKRNIEMLCLWGGLFLAVVVATIVFFLFVKARFLYAFLFGALNLLGFIGLVVSTLAFVLAVKVGQRSFKKTKTLQGGKK